MPYARRRRLVSALAILCLILASGNGLRRANATGETYIVRQGDTLSSIALRYGTTVSALMTANNLSNADKIVIGQVLSVGSDAGASQGTSVAVATSASSATYSTATMTTTTYVVQAGDTLSAISGRFGLSLTALAQANNINAPFTIDVGQQLSIPSETSGLASASVTTSTASGGTQGTTYTVQAGDTLSAISQQFGIGLDALISANNITNPSSLRVGQQLLIPGGSPQEAVIGSAAIGAILTAEAEAAGISASLVKAVAWQESGWQMVTASDGGIGVMQLMPDSVTWVSTSLLGYQIDPYNATDNIRGGVAMLRYYLRIYGDVRDTLAAYHQGMLSLQTDGVLPGTESYIANILALQQQFGG